MIACTQARSWFGAYWDDEITQAEREALEAHFTGCPACRTEYEGLAHTLELVASLPRHEASPELLEHTIARVRRVAVAPDRLRATPRPAWVPLAAAATLLIVGAGLLAPWLGSRGRVDGPVAARTASPREPQLVRVSAGAPAVDATSQGALATATPASALVDSLIDHSADVDFVLDPVHVSRGRMVSNPLKQRAQGQQAVITF